MATRLIRKNPYVLFILLLLVSFLIFSVWSAQRAATRGSRISDPEYYSKGLKYNNTRVEERAAASQGWTLETVIEQKTLHFKLFDRKNLAIEHAAGKLTLFLGEQKRILRLPLKETRPGRYVVSLPAGTSGSLQAQVEFEKQGALINRQLLVNL